MIARDKLTSFFVPLTFVTLIALYRTLLLSNIRLQFAFLKPYSETKMKKKISHSNNEYSRFLVLKKPQKIVLKSSVEKFSCSVK